MIFSQFFNDFYYIEVLRALVDASSASYARIQSAVLRRIVYQLVHKPLTEALHLRGARIGCRHLSKIGIHARIPAAETQHSFVGPKVAYIETLACGAHESARAASEARFAERLPQGRVEQFV